MLKTYLTQLFEICLASSAIFSSAFSDSCNCRICCYASSPFSECASPLLPHMLLYCSCEFTTQFTQSCSFQFMYLGSFHSKSYVRDKREVLNLFVVASVARPLQAHRGCISRYFYVQLCRRLSQRRTIPKIRPDQVKIAAI